MKTLKEQALDQVINDLQESKTNFIDNPFRLGSLMYFETIKEVKRLVHEQKYRLTEVDKHILETDLGDYEVYEGELVPLDCPMMNIVEDDLAAWTLSLSANALSNASARTIDVPT